MRSGTIKRIELTEPMRFTIGDRLHKKLQPHFYDRPELLLFFSIEDLIEKNHKKNHKWHLLISISDALVYFAYAEESAELVILFQDSF